jgi:hypothetical protein
MVVNVFAAYPIYIIAAIFSGQIWLGLFAAFLFWLGMLMFHGVLTTKTLRYPYNPGLLTTVAGVALGISTSSTSSPATWRVCGIGSGRSCCSLCSSWS